MNGRKEKDSNLEAKNEILKGVIRTPLSFLGGPIGVLANIIATAASTKYEIDREEEHKIYLESLKHEPDLDSLKRRSSEARAKLDYLWEAFRDANKYNWPTDTYLNVPYNDYCKQTTISIIRRQPVAIWLRDGAKYSGISYCMDDFYDIFMRDSEDPTMEKYLIKNRMCYRVDSKPYFVCCRSSDMKMGYGDGSLAD